MGNNNSQDMRQKMAAMQRQQMAQGIAPNLLPGVGINDLIDIKCDTCGSTVFYPAHTLKFASRLMSRNGQPTLVQFPLGFACASCNKINPFDAAALQAGLETPADKDGRELKAKQEKEKEETTPGPDLGISVEDGTVTGEKLN